MWTYKNGSDSGVLSFFAAKSIDSSVFARGCKLHLEDGLMIADDIVTRSARPHEIIGEVILIACAFPNFSEQKRRCLRRDIRSSRHAKFEAIVARFPLENFLWLRFS